MNLLKKILVVLWKVWLVVLSSVLVLIIGVFWTFPLALSSKTFPLAYKGIRLWALLSFYGSGFRLESQGSTQLNKDQTYLFIANHSSMIDILILAILHPNHPLVFVGKEELARIPIFGKIYRQICITVDRKSARSKAHVFGSAKQKISQGNSLVIFPEGGIADDQTPVLHPFKDGAFTIGIATQTPIAVYALKGPKEMFPEAWTKGYPGKVIAELVEVIPTENLSLADKNALKNHCFHQLETALMRQ